MVFMVVMVVVMFYFLLFRPQQKQRKSRKIAENVKDRRQVLLNSGFSGIVLERQGQVADGEDRRIT